MNSLPVADPDKQANRAPCFAAFASPEALIPYSFFTDPCITQHTIPYRKLTKQNTSI